MKCRVTVDIPDGEGWVEALGLGRDGPVQQFHTANVLRRILNLFFVFLQSYTDTESGFSPSR